MEPTRAGTTSYSLSDGQGSVRALTNSSGEIADSYRYDAFGNLLSHQGTTTSVYGYDSQRFDAATGLYALRARSYDPTTGRFLSRDPARDNTTDPAQLDRYVYAAADPIMQSDPSGREISQYAETLTQDVAIEEVELPELSDFSRFALNLFALVVENATGVALTPTEYAWVAWRLAAMGSSRPIWRQRALGTPSPTSNALPRASSRVAQVGLTLALQEAEERSVAAVGVVGVVGAQA